MLAHERSHTAGPTWLDLIFALAVVVFVGTAVWALIDHAFLLQRTLAAPFVLSYAEGISIDRALQMPDLRALYPAQLLNSPLRISPEPPLFPALLAAFGRGVDPASTLYASRSISLIAYIAAGFAAAAATFGMTRSISGAIVSGLLLMLFPQVQNASALAVPDSSALMFSLGGLALATLFGASLHRGRRITGMTAASACFIVALGLRPEFAFPAIACACAWLLVKARRRAALTMLFGIAAIAALAVLVLQIATNGGFVAHVFDYGVREWSKDNAIGMTLNLLLRSGLIFVPSVLFLITEPMGARHIAARPTLALLVAAFAFMFVNSRYAIGWSTTLPLCAAVCIGFGITLAWLNQQRWLAVLAIAFALLQIETLKEWRAVDFAPNLTRRLNTARDVERLNALLLRTSGIILTDEHIGMLSLHGRQPVIYPLEFNALHRRGGWSTDALIAAIERREFALIAWYEPLDRNEYNIMTRWPEEVRKAVYRNYSDGGYLSDTVLYVPASP